MILCTIKNTLHLITHITLLFVPRKPIAHPPEDRNRAVPHSKKTNHQKPQGMQEKRVVYRQTQQEKAHPKQNAPDRLQNDGYTPHKGRRDPTHSQPAANRFQDPQQKASQVEGALNTQRDGSLIDLLPTYK